MSNEKEQEKEKYSKTLRMDEITFKRWEIFYQTLERAGTIPSQNDSFIIALNEHFDSLGIPSLKELCSPPAPKIDSSPQNDQAIPTPHPAPKNVS